MTLENLIAALRQEVTRIDEAIVAVEHLLDANEKREKAANAFEANYGGAKPVAPQVIRLLHRHRDT